MKKFLSIIIVSALLASCSQHKNYEADALVSHIDSTVKPQDDIFLYANGKWFKENPIPASEQSNGLWQLIQDTINAQIKNICESSASLTNAEKGSNKQKIGDFFYSGMDSVSLNKKEISDLKDELDLIDAIKDLKDLIKVAAYIHQTSGSPMFGFYVGQDDKISSKNAVFIGQGGLSLPDRNFYFDNDERATIIRKEFVNHVNNMFEILGYDKTKAKEAADHLMKLETSIAQTSRKREDTRDPLKNYNKITFKQLTESTSNIDWNLFIESIGLKKVDTVIVGQPEFLTALNGYIKTYSINDWKNYLKFHLVRGLARYMDDKTFNESFHFYTTILRGVPEPKPRWKRVVGQTDGSLGELVGQVYVSEYLPKGTKEKLMEIGTAIKDVYAERIKKLDWMSEATKVKAIKKLNTIVMKVGYPDKWKDMSSLEIDRSSYVQNNINVDKWQYNYMINKYGKPVDRSEWNMFPQTYNAYYEPTNNEIVVPACNIIIPGFEGRMPDDAALYGVIGGSTFGHEITHGFDDQGSLFDENGNLKDWWTKEDRIKFVAKTKSIVKQFDSYVVLDSMHVKGKNSQGENIADLGGVIMGYEAFKKTKQGQSTELINGYNSDQRYFLSYGYAWMINITDAALATQIMSNEHSPAQFRVNGPLSDIDAFYKAFNIQQGDNMYRTENDRVKIW